MTRTTDITNFAEYRRHLSQHFKRVKKTGRPLYVTRDGKPEAVVLSPEAYDELADRADLQETLAMIDRSEADIKAGRERPLRKAMKDLAKKHGINLDR